MKIDFNTNKFAKVSLILFLLLVVLSGGWLLVYKLVKNHYLAKKIKQEEVILQLTKGEPQAFTGVDINASPSSPLINIKWELISKMPLDEKLFKMQFDFKLNKFIVKLDVNGDSLSAFRNWLQENGYGELPSEDFVYTN